MSAAPLYRAEDLTRVYQQGESPIRALDGVRLEVERGDYLVISGPSGSGKTTLLHILGLLDRDYQGRLLFCADDITDKSATELAAVRLEKIGVIYQAFFLLPALDVRDNVALPHWHLHGRRDTARRKAEAALCDLGLEKRLRHPVNRLSTGEMQRVAIARALINDPSVVLADEPTGNLDEENTAAIVTLLNRIHDQGHTIIVITHDKSSKMTATRHLRLEYGRICEQKE